VIWLLPAGQPVRLKDIARRQQICSRILGIDYSSYRGGLRKNPRPERVMLARPPAEIPLKEVMEILEGPLAPVECLRDSRSCARSGLCATQDLWNDLKKAMEGVLEANTLQDLASRQKSKAGSASEMYYI
jgi:DNA-binding IscR family transcriptional regulator